MVDTASPALRPDPGCIAQFATQLAVIQGVADTGGRPILFFGDSITQGWLWNGSSWSSQLRGRGGLNFGIGGDTTGHLLFRLQNGLLDNVKPSAVVMLIGVNDLFATAPVQRVVAGIEACLTEIRTRQPDARILLLGILPTRGGASAVAPMAQEVNAQLPQLAERERADFIDTRELFLGPDGCVPAELMPDGAHLSPAAYEILTKVVVSWLDAAKH